VNPFDTEEYRAINKARLDHLASLGLEMPAGLRVLDVCAGVGDHAAYYQKFGCRVDFVEGRLENVNTLMARFPGSKTWYFDVCDEPAIPETYDRCHFYGGLYHLHRPEDALDFIAAVSSELVMETQVQWGDGLRCDAVDQNYKDPTQGVEKFACMPTRRWVWMELKKRWPNVYMPFTQPRHPDFKLKWQGVEPGHRPHRAVFVASTRDCRNWLAPMTSAFLDTQSNG
jgi:SAM-dependent methyltransferase